MGKEYCITAYGAVGDGQQLITEALQKAVDACAQDGGGIVSIPAGEYVCGTVQLKSHVTLLLKPGSVLKASEKLSDYRQIGFYHNEMGETVSFLYALDQQHIRITGDGEIHLSDHAFIDFGRLHPLEFPEESLSDTQWEEATAMYLDRPNQPLFFHNCRHVAVDRVTIRRSPYWTLTFSCCERVSVDHIVIDNHLRVPNSDGIHVCASKDVSITNCTMVCGDDCIAVTGITAWDGIAERIHIANCTFTSRSSAIRLGHLSSKVRDVLIHHIIVRDSNRGLGIFAGDEGFVERVSASHLIMETRIKAGAWWGQGEPLVISAVDGNGRIEDVAVSDVSAESEFGVVIIGHERNVKAVRLTDWRLALSSGHNRPLYGRRFDLAPFSSRPVPSEGLPWLYAEEVQELTLRHIRYRGDGEVVHESAKLEALDVAQAGVTA